MLCFCLELEFYNDHWFYIYTVVALKQAQFESH